MAEVFVSYTSTDRDWAFWLGKELSALGHVPHLHEWEIGPGADIYAWMEHNHQSADHVLCVVSDAYLKAPYSALERNAAAWQSTAKRPRFALFAVVKPCEMPTLSDHLRRCELHSVSEMEARNRFRKYMEKPSAPDKAAFPGKPVALSNVPLNIPLHFTGRSKALLDIDLSFARQNNPAVILALNGLRGVGKSTLAAVYADNKRDCYRAIWWVRAQSPATMRADLVALGVRLNWIDAREQEQPALDIVFERLRHEGSGILIIYDNAVDANSLSKYLPRNHEVRVLITSNSPTWRSVAEPIHIDVWPSAVGASYLVSRTGRLAELREAAVLSEALGGLPLAHEQAAAFCERLELPLDEYSKRLASDPLDTLADARDAPTNYNDGLTVAKTFALGIEEATKLHAASGPLIMQLALFAAEPIPLYVLLEGRTSLDPSLSALLEGDGLIEALSSLRAFALIDREAIADERYPNIITDTVRLHRLVREIASARLDDDEKARGLRKAFEIVATAYPADVFSNPGVWPRARRLDTLALNLVSGAVPPKCEQAAAHILDRLAAYRHGVTSRLGEARDLRERAIAITEKYLGPDAHQTGTMLNNLGLLQTEQGDYDKAAQSFERALDIHEKVLGKDSPETSNTLSNFASLMQSKGDYVGAKFMFERALVIEEALGDYNKGKFPSLLNKMGLLLKEEGRYSDAIPYHQRALAMMTEPGPDNSLALAATLNNLAFCLYETGDKDEAVQRLFSAHSLTEHVLGTDHPTSGISHNNLAVFYNKMGKNDESRYHLKMSLEIFNRSLGSEHPNTITALVGLGAMLHSEGELSAAQEVLERAVEARQRKLGPMHPHTAMALDNLASITQDQGDYAKAKSLYETALRIFEHNFGTEHPDTHICLKNYMTLLQVTGDADAIERLKRRFKF